MSYIKSWSHLQTKTYECNYEKAEVDLFQINFTTYMTHAMPFLYCHYLLGFLLER